MGLFNSITVNHRANTICALFRELENLINSNRGVNDNNYFSVTSTIAKIESEYGYMQQPLLDMGFNKRDSLSLKWTDGRSYPLLMWEGCVKLSLEQAKLIVNKYHKRYQ
jgi:hypothetical protein